MVQTEIEGRVGRGLECLFGKGIVFLFLLLVPQFAFGQGEQFRGTIITEEGQTRVVEEFKNLEDNLDAKFRGSYTDFPITDIKSVVRVDDNVLVVTNREGREIKVKGEIKDMANVGRAPYNLHYSSINPVTGEYSQTYINTSDVKKIVFNEDYGSLRRCPDGGKTFPPDYVYCPYHKTELELIQVGE